jgi:transcriptional regulator with PAS, ATPase and Fis domain
MQKGASDYIPKTVENNELVDKIRKLYEMTYAKKTSGKIRSYSEIVGESNCIRNLIDVISTVAQSNMPVFLKGESGTGKSLIAETIHKYSKRKDGPFVTINCPATSPMLLESEFFGHEKGSFTGAINTKEGKFEIANGGTIFLDEIGTLSLDLQVKILRVIQNKEFERVGGLKTIKVDVRIIAATNQDIEQSVQEGKFREDLYYRLNVLPIFVPPLRNRKEDIPILAEHFLKQFAKSEGKKFNKLSNEVLTFLRSYDWPGNIRELDNIIGRAVVMGREPDLKISDFSSITEAKNKITKKIDEEPLTSLKDMEHTELVRALKDSSGNISRAAKILGISRVALYRRMKKYGIELKN